LRAAPHPAKLPLARDRLIPDKPDFSVPASRACPLTEALTESAMSKPKNYIPLALGLALSGNFCQGCSFL